MRLKTFAIGLSVCALIALVAPASEAARPGQRVRSAAGWGDCVRTVRALSDFTIRGDAWMWWQNAAGQYVRDSRPTAGSVLVFKRTASMGRGHVSLVSKVVDSRTVLVDHTWIAGRGIKRGMQVIDVSANNDWSAVRVWHGPTDQLGQRVYPTYGFIQPDGGKPSGELIMAVDRGDDAPSAARFDETEAPVAVSPRGRKPQIKSTVARAPQQQQHRSPDSPAYGRMFSAMQASALAVPPRKPLTPVHAAAAHAANGHVVAKQAAPVAAVVPARKPASRVTVKKEIKETIVAPARKPKAA